MICHACGIDDAKRHQSCTCEIATDYENYRIRYERIRFGDELVNERVEDQCPGCGTPRGGLHHAYCSMEECPKCHRLLLWCEAHCEYLIPEYCKACGVDIYDEDAGQSCTCTSVYTRGGIRYNRIRFGMERPAMETRRVWAKCGTCNTPWGGLHHVACGGENCPRCGHGWLGCGCRMIFRFDGGGGGSPPEPEPPPVPPLPGKRERVPA